MAPLSFPPKRTAEVLTYALDFKPMLGVGEIITSGVWAVGAVQPVTASVEDMLNGTPTIVSGVSFQRIGGGDNDALYVLIATVYTSHNNVIQENALLRITDSPFI